MLENYSNNFVFLLLLNKQTGRQWKKTALCNLTHMKCHKASLQLQCINKHVFLGWNYQISSNLRAFCRKMANFWFTRFRGQFLSKIWMGGSLYFSMTGVQWYTKIDKYQVCPVLLFLRWGRRGDPSSLEFWNADSCYYATQGIGCLQWENNVSFWITIDLQVRNVSRCPEQHSKPLNTLKKSNNRFCVKFKTTSG